MKMAIVTRIELDFMKVSGLSASSSIFRSMKQTTSLMTSTTDDSVMHTYIVFVVYGCRHHNNIIYNNRLYTLGIIRAYIYILCVRVCCMRYYIPGPLLYVLNTVCYYIYTLLYYSTVITINKKECDGVGQHLDIQSLLCFRVVHLSDDGYGHKQSEQTMWRYALS